MHAALASTSFVIKILLRPITAFICMLEFEIYDVTRQSGSPKAVVPRPNTGCSQGQAMSAIEIAFNST